MSHRVFSIEAKQTSKTSYNYRDIAEHIAQYEDFESEPYLDLNKGGYVIGHGLSAKGRTYITEERSYQILEQEVKRLAKLVIAQYNDVTQDEMKGMVGILYNTPGQQALVRNERIIGHVKSNNKQAVAQFYETQIVNMERHIGVKLGGLRTRREKELNLLFNTI